MFNEIKLSNHQDKKLKTEKIADFLLTPARLFLGRTYQILKTKDGVTLSSDTLSKLNYLAAKICVIALLPLSLLATAIGLLVKKLSRKTQSSQQFLSNILLDLEANKDQLSNNYKQAVHTIGSFIILNSIKDKLDRTTLTSKVKEFTGLLIHAAENYPKIEVFNNTVENAIGALEQAYSEFKNNNDKLRFLHCSLKYSGCIEGRIEEIMNYVYPNTKDPVYHLLMHERQFYNLTHKLPWNQGVHIDDFFSYLKEKNFFKQYEKHYSINEKDFLRLPAFENLVKNQMICVETLPLITDRILDCFPYYTDFFSGLPKFKEHVLSFCNLKFAEIQTIDLAIKEFCSEHPDKAKLL